MSAGLTLAADWFTTARTLYLPIAAAVVVLALVAASLLIRSYRVPVLAVARLTFAEGIRMRIVLVFLVLLGALMLILPTVMKGDQTLSGRLQAFLYYAIGAMSILLSLTTVFLACYSLSEEIRSRTLHLVVTKPVTRIQILLGKWYGVMLLNLVLLTICGATIYGFAWTIRQQEPINARDGSKLRDVVWTARVGAKPVRPDMTAAATAWVDERIARNELRPDDENHRKRMIAERAAELLGSWRIVPPATAEEIGRIFEFENLPPPARADEVVQVSYKVRGIPIPPNEQLRIVWLFVDPETRAPLHEPRETVERSGDQHEFFVRAGAFEGGRAALAVINPPSDRNRISLTFEGDDSLQIFYKVGSFEANYLRAMLIVFLRLAFLAAVGVFFSAFVSFPVAAFCMLAAYVLCLGMPTWMESIGANIELYTPSIDPYGGWWGKPIRFVMVPILWFFFPDFVALDGADRLIEGRYIPLDLIAVSALRLLVFGGVILLVLGTLVFQRREVAEVTA